ncbi:hypothetical protein CesoFtcFv8_025490 [Champsocephalus esox]|uniref:Uncharacterized protein n=1 Tax=Champsocephalus esox TaxID=159716 RepID=A0AAN8B4D7_9TELE|nr:hypothetical protein CesoFtcFv8_025490 [Champsocephalus esox]
MEEEETPAPERREVLTREKERMDVEEEGETEKPSKEDREEEGGEEETGESLQETLVTKKVFSATTRSTIVEETLEETEKAKEDEEGREEDEAQAKTVLGSWVAEVSSDEKPPLPDPAFNRRCSLIVSEVKYKEDFEKMRGQSLFVPGAELIHSKNISAVISESKYKEEGKKEASMSLYSILPQTPEIQHAKEASQLQSDVKYKEKISPSLYSLLPETTETQFVKGLTEMLSENNWPKPYTNFKARKSTKKTGRGGPPSLSTPNSQKLQKYNTLWRCPRCRVR